MTTARKARMEIQTCFAARTLFIFILLWGLVSTQALPVAPPSAPGFLRKQRPAFDISECQFPKKRWQNPLSGCPDGTVFVSYKRKDASFQSIGAAVRSLPDDGSTRIILIDEGSYREKIVVTRRSPTIFAGVSFDVADTSKNRVRIWQHSYVNQSDPNNRLSNCDAVTLGIGDGGSGVVDDFKAYNIDFVQRQFYDGKEVTQYQLGPSAALCIQKSNASFYGCSFNSYQDTIYVADGSNAFFFKSTIRGTTDQIYGEGRAWFERCTLLSRACGGGITAWRGDPDKPLAGVYISNSSIARSLDASTLKDMTGRCHLGRPWNVYAKAVYLNNWMGDIVAPQGFKGWGSMVSNFEPDKTFFAEYNSSGPGGDLMSKRDFYYQKVLSDYEAKFYTYHRIFDHDTAWIDQRPLQTW